MYVHLENILLFIREYKLPINENTVREHVSRHEVIPNSGITRSEEAAKILRGYHSAFQECLCDDQHQRIRITRILSIASTSHHGESATP